MLSKRHLSRLVHEGHVDDWDDPRLPTLRGLRRRGYPPAAIRDFARRIGVTKRDNTVEFAMLEHFAREVLNRTAERRMAVLRPLKLVIKNYPPDQVEHLEAVNNPEDAGAGTRAVPFTRELFIERDDFMENPPRKFFRLAPGREVRLRYAYFVTCREVVRDATGAIEELHCTYDPESRGGNAPDGRRVKATLHWVSARHARPADVHLYHPLFLEADPRGGGDAFEHLNPTSREELHDCMVEPAVADLTVGTTVQFERQGYFCLDTASRPGRLVLNRTVALRDSWAKVARRNPRRTDDDRGTGPRPTRV